MSKRLEKDSFLEVTRRKKAPSAKTVLPPNTRARTSATANQKQSAIPSQIDTSKTGSDETSHFSHVSRKSTSSQLQSEFSALMKEREKQHQEQMRERQQQFDGQLAAQLTESKKLYLTQISDLKSEYSDAVNDYKSTIDGLNFSVRESNIENNNLRKNNQELTSDLFNVSSELAHEKNKSKLVTDKKSSSQKKTKFSSTEVDSHSDEDSTSDESSHPSVTPDANKNNKNKNTKASTSPSGTTNTTPANGTQAGNPFSTPLPPGYGWSQYVDNSGRTLWHMVVTPAPPSSIHTPTTGNQNPFQINLNQNPNFSHGTQFTAPPGCLQFSRSTWSKVIKDITCNSDELNDVKAWYDHVRSCLLSSTNGKEVLPKIENLNKTYDFKAALLPPLLQANYQRAKADFDGLSSALRLYLTKKSTFKDCTSVSIALELHKGEDCGLELLLKLLAEVFPHLGAGYVDFVTEVTKLSLRENDSIETLLRKTLGLQRTLEHSNQIHPPNSIIHKFLSKFRQNSNLDMKLSSIYLKYNEHLEQFGPNVEFPLQPYDVYRHLKLLGVDLKKGLTIDNPNIISHQDIVDANEEEGLFRSPTAKAAFVQVEEKAKQLYPDKKHTRNYKKAHTRYNRCTICNEYHPFGPDPELRCPARGPEWIQDWKRKAAVKFNAMNPSQKPDTDFVNAPPPVRSGTTKPTAKQITIPVSDQDEVQDSDSDDDFFDANEILESDNDASVSSENIDNIQPEIKIAQVNPDDQSCSVDSDGMYYY